MTTITIDNVLSRAEGERKIEKLSVATQSNYHNLTFSLYPLTGSFFIQVTAEYEFLYESGRPMTETDAQNELKELMVYILMNQI